MSFIKVNKIQHLGSSGDGLVIDNKGTVGVSTSGFSTSLVGAASSMVGLYIGDGSLLFNNTLDRSEGYYIATETNALNAGPVSLGSTLTLDGTWVIV
tara:strand:+ start:291 stop:581 length:291 start_codon:yes stop_codon:yes gene_type:complete